MAQRFMHSTCGKQNFRCGRLRGPAYSVVKCCQEGKPKPDPCCEETDCECEE